jgi:predicted enzyme related to lactoylglutathione lyase
MKPSSAARQNRSKKEFEMANAIFWFEIPAADIDRAIAFYSQILGTELQKMEVNQGYPMAMLPDSMGGHGFSAFFIDSEGNKIGLAAPKQT